MIIDSWPTCVNIWNGVSPGYVMGQETHVLFFCWKWVIWLEWIFKEYWLKSLIRTH